MPTSTASLSLSRPGSSRNTGSGVGQPQQPASTEPVVPPWRRVSRQENNAMDSTRLRLIIPPPPPPPSAMAPPPPPPPPPPPAPAVQSKSSFFVLSLSSSKCAAVLIHLTFHAFLPAGFEKFKSGKYPNMSQSNWKSTRRRLGNGPIGRR